MNRAKALGKFGGTHAVIIDKLGECFKAERDKNATLYTVEEAIYQPDSLELLFGVH